MVKRDEEDKGTVLDALGDIAVETAQLTLAAAKAGKYSDALELSNLTERLTNQIFRIEDHTKTKFNRSGSDVNEKMAGSPSEKLGPTAPAELRNP